MVMNKKAQGLSTNTIILIILGLVVLVVLIIGFTMGFKNLKEKIIPSDNVQTIANQCEYDCNLGQDYNYCNKEILLETDKETIEETSCYVLYKKRSEYKFPACPEIDCGIYDDKENAVEFCEGKENEEGADLDEVGKIEVFYIDGMKVEKTTCNETTLA